MSRFITSAVYCALGMLGFATAPLATSAASPQDTITRISLACVREYAKGVMDNATPNPLALERECPREAEHLVTVSHSFGEPYRVRALQTAATLYSAAATGAQQLGHVRLALQYFQRARSLERRCLTASDANSDQRDIARVVLAHLDDEIGALSTPAPVHTARPVVITTPRAVATSTPPPCNASSVATDVAPVATWRTRRAVSARFQVIVKYLPFMEWFEVQTWSRLTSTGDSDLDAAAEDALPSHFAVRSTCTADQTPITTTLTITLVPEH